MMVDAATFRVASFPSLTLSCELHPIDAQKGYKLLAILPLDRVKKRVLLERSAASMEGAQPLTGPTGKTAEHRKGES